MQTSDRYHRQTLLPQVGVAGQNTLRSSHVLLVGCGALGTGIAQYLARAGIGHLTLVDRDLVDLTNLHRQVLFTEADAAEQMPKAIAAANALRAANSAIHITARVTDVHSANLAELATPLPNLIIDGTDNALTRYLLNDFAVWRGIPWIYGACVGTEGRVLAIVPGQSACLRCLFPEPPAPGELATCDTAGVLPSAAGVTAALQAGQAMRLLIEGPSASGKLVALDAWTMQFRTLDAGSGTRREDCPCCGLRRFDFLDRPPAVDTVAMCGRDAVQIRPAAMAAVDLPAMARRLANLGDVKEAAFMLRFVPADQRTIAISVFPDGRVLVTGTADLALARSLAARFVGQ